MNIEQEILAYISTELAQGKPDLGPATNLAGVVDSTAVMEIVVWLEGKYGVEVEVDDITPDNFGSVSALAAYVRKRKE